MNLAAAALILLGATQVLSDQGKDPVPDDLMMVFSEAHDRLQKGLANEDWSAVSHQAKAISQAIAAAPAEETQRRDEPQWAEHFSQLDQLAAKLAQSGGTGEGEIPKRLAAELTQTCVACHARFSDLDEVIYPARGNIITGKIKIVQADGTERADRSAAVVFLDRVEAGAGFSPPLPVPLISQQDMNFVPRVLPVVRGTAVDFPNNDNIFHNIFSLSKAKIFDLGVYKVGEAKTVRFDQTGWVKIYCNIHPKMIAHLLVLDNPFFSLSAPDGHFLISGVPDGAYTLRTWHEYGKETRTQIRVAGEQVHRQGIVIRENKRFVQHKDKFGKPYKGKYR